MLSSFFSSVIAMISYIRILDIIDIATVAFAIYKIIQFISRTRAQQLVKGLLVLVIALIVSDVLDLYTVHFILNAVMTYGLMAIIVIFYPELRRALEYLGRSKLFFSKQFSNVPKNTAKEVISQICKAVEYFSSNKTGALIVIEQEIALGDIIENGTRVDAEITAMLLDTIFYEGSALHDGAVIIRQDRLLAAGCVLPLTRNDSLERTLGTRHRAGIGITEVSDAVSIIVSEETGIISMATDGVLSRFLDVKSVEKKLYSIYLSDIESSDTSGTLMNFFRRIING
jgi:diadenylate cyclase